MLIARSLSTLHHDTAPIHVCLPPRRTWPAVVFLMPTWAILKGFAYCLPYPKICLISEMFAHISLTMYIGNVFISWIVSTFFAKRNIHLRKYTFGSSDICICVWHVVNNLFKLSRPQRFGFVEERHKFSKSERFFSKTLNI